MSEATLKDARRMRKRASPMPERSSDLNDVTPGGSQGETGTRRGEKQQTEGRVGLTDTQGAQRGNRPSRPQRKK